MPAPDDENIALWQAINLLMTNYWAEVDYNGGEKAHEFYLPDALYAVGNNRFEGIEKIRAFYDRRRQIGNSTTRHLITNLQVFATETAPQARAIGIMTLYRADGRPPFRGIKPPSMIADFEAQCALTNGRQWRFRSHLLRPIFVSSDLPVSITIDPQRL
jgi:SnoaL-like domain